MKTVVLFIVAVFLMLVPMRAIAQEQVPSASSASSGMSTPAGMTSEDAQAAREDLQALAKAMGADVPAQPAAEEKPEEAPQKKTVADVADKALDMVSGFVTRISQNLEKVAPEVWRIMIRQQYAKAFADIIVPLAVLLLLFVIKSRLNKAWPNGSWGEENNDRELGENVRAALLVVIPWILIFFIGIWLSTCVADSIKYLVNPEYYAVRDLLSLLLNPVNAQ